MLNYLRSLFSKNVSEEHSDKLNNGEHDGNTESMVPIGSTEKFTPNENLKPNKIRLVTDNYHLEGLGQLDDGSFFLVCSEHAFDHENMQSTDYICKFSFDNKGNLTDHTIIKLGLRNEVVREDGVKAYTQLHPVKGTFKAADFFVKPFSVEFDGVEFGLIVRTPEDEEDLWCVEFLPGNNMAFYEPWDSGLYDT